MNTGNFILAIQNLVNWVKAGIATRQTKALVGTGVPDNSVGAEGDIFLVVD